MGEYKTSIAREERSTTGRKSRREVTWWSPSGSELHEATYGCGDTQEVVAAAFSCHLCLARAGYILLSVSEAVAIAICCDCGAETDVALTGEQAVRLAACPPAGLQLQSVW